MVTLISIYITFGLVIGLIVDSAYIRRDNGDTQFNNLTGQMTWGMRIITISLWPLVLVTAIVLFAKERRGKNDGD